MTLEELQVVITAQTSGLRSELGRVNTQLNSVRTQATRSADGIGKAFSKVAKVIAVLGIGKVIKDSFADAAQVNNNIENLSNMLGENSTSFMNWANNQAKSFGIAKKEAMSYGMTFANLVSGFSSGTAQTTQITTQLLQTSSVIASKTGRSMEDVMERIRSGMLGNTEAVEDLGIYASSSAMQQTQAYKTMANGTPWNKLDYYAKQQIITFGLLEQASTKYGNTMSGGLTTQMLIFRAELSNLKTSLGQAFVPIVSAVIPYLMAMIKYIQVAINYVVAFVQLLFGLGSATESSQGLADTTQQTSNNMGSSAGNAGLTADNLGTAAKNAKKLKGALAGFDEINTLKMDDGSDAAGGAGAGGAGGASVPGGGISMPMPALDNSAMDNSMTAIKDNIKAWLSGIDFSPLIDSFDRVKESIAPIIDTIGNNIKWFIDSILAPLAKWTIEDALPAFFNLLAGALDVLSPILEAFSTTGQWLWDNFLAPIAEWTGGVIVDVLDGMADALSSIGDWMSDNMPVMENLALIITSIGIAIGIVKAAMIIHSAIMAIWGGVMWVATYGTTALGVAMLSVSWPIVLIIAAIAAVIAIVLLLIKNWDWVKEVAINVFTAIKEFIGNACASIGKFFSQLWDGIVFVFSVVGTFFTDMFTGAFNGVTNAFSSIGSFFSGLWDGIVFVFSVVGTFFTDMFTGAFNGVKKAFSSIGSFFSGIWSGIKSVFGGVADWFGGVFTKAWTAVKTVFSTGGKIFDGIKDGILNGLKAVINGLIGGINKIISIPFKGINWALSKIKNISILGVEPFGWIETINVPQIPKLAKGGIVDSAQMFIAGEAGKEVVMPLENNTGWITQLAEKVATRMPQGADNSGISGDLTLMIDGSVIGKVALSQLRKMQRQGSVTLIPT